MNVWKATKSGKLDWLEKHVEAEGPGQLNAADKSGETPLLIAVKAQDDEVVRFLLEKGADPNITSKSKDKCTSPLLVAIIEGCSEEIISTLLEHNAAVDVHDADGCTPLHWAVRSEGEAVVQLLLERGADANAKTTDTGFTALHYAAKQGNQNIAHALLASGAEKDAVDASGQTPLFSAIDAESADVVRELVDSGCDLNVRDKDGETVLHLLASSGQDATNLLQFILTKKPDPDAKNNQGHTPLRLARVAGHNAIVESLIKHGAEDDGLGSSTAPHNEEEQATPTQSSTAHAVGGEKQLEKLRHRPSPSRKKQDDTEVGDFLSEAGLDVHAPRFRRNQLINLEDLEGLDAKALKKMNITAGEREKILAEVAKLAPVLATRREAREQAEKAAEAVKKAAASHQQTWVYAVVAGAVFLVSLFLFLSTQAQKAN